MSGHFTYSVYKPEHSESIVPPTSFRTAPRPQKGGGFMGFGLVVLTVVVLIGGGSYAAQHYLEGQLADGPRLSQAAAPASPPPAASEAKGPPPVAPVAATPAVPAAAPTDPAVTSTEGLVAVSPHAQLARNRRKLSHKRIGTGGTDTAALDIEGVPRAPTGRPSPEPVPPNPF